MHEEQEKHFFLECTSFEEDVHGETKINDNNTMHALLVLKILEKDVVQYDIH